MARQEHDRRGETLVGAAIVLNLFAVEFADEPSHGHFALALSRVQHLHGRWRDETLLTYVAFEMCDAQAQKLIVGASDIANRRS